MNNTKKNRLPLYIGIPVILLLIFLRFGLYFLKSDGFSGLSMLLPILLLLFYPFCLVYCCFLCGVGISRFAKRRGDDPVLWAIVVFIATPFIGLLIYFLRRSEIKATCLPAASNFNESKIIVANVEHILKIGRLNGVMVKQGTHHLKIYCCGYCQHGAYADVFDRLYRQCCYGNGVNTNVASNDRVWEFRCN